MLKIKNKKMKTIIRENTWLARGLLNFCWSHGYVIIPKGHKLWGKNYDEVDVSVHGGLTYSELADEDWCNDFGIVDESYIGGWVFGFDTCHCYDTLEKWTKERVEKETENLKIQLENY